MDDCHFCYITKLNPSPQKRGKKKSLHNTASQPACLLASLRPSLPPCLAAAAVAAVLLLWLQLHDHDHLLHCPDAQPRPCSAFLPWLLPICTTCAFIASCTHMRDRHTDRQTQRERERERERAETTPTTTTTNLVNVCSPPLQLLILYCFPLLLLLLYLFFFFFFLLFWVFFFWGF